MTGAGDEGEGVGAATLRTAASAVLDRLKPSAVPELSHQGGKRSLLGRGNDSVLDQPMGARARTRRWQFGRPQEPHPDRGFSAGCQLADC